MPDPCVECGRIDDDAGVHHPAGIPDVLHLGEQTQPVGAVHPAEQFGAGPAVAVLTGHRAAKRDNEIGGLLDERSVDRQAAAAEQIEVDPHVHAALAEVAVGGAGQSVPTHQLVQTPQIVGQAFRRHRRVLPAAPRLGAVGAAGGEPGGIRAAPPEHRLSAGVGDQ